MPWRFSFYDTNGLRFRENLERFHCHATNDGGEHCHNICVIGEPYCWVHLLYRKHLRIKKSRIQGADKGCFAINPKLPNGAIIFRANEDILNYHGEIISKHTLNERYGRHTAPYGVEISRPRNLYEDGALERSPMACVNAPPHGVQANVRLTTNQQRTFIKMKAIRDVRNGEELYAEYGADYWRGNRDRGHNGASHFDTRYVR